MILLPLPYQTISHIIKPGVTWFLFPKDSVDFLAIWIDRRWIRISFLTVVGRSSDPCTECPLQKQSDIFTFVISFRLNAQAHTVEEILLSPPHEKFLIEYVRSPGIWEWISIQFFPLWNETEIFGQNNFCRPKLESNPNELIWLETHQNSVCYLDFEEIYKNHWIFFSWVKGYCIEQWFPTFWVLSPGILFNKQCWSHVASKLSEIPPWQLFWSHLDHLQVPVLGPVPVFGNLWHRALLCLNQSIE